MLSSLVNIFLLYVCLSLFVFNSVTTNDLKRYDVVIVGAGVAGIEAGQKLLDNNISNILILEARDRIGGRIHTIKFGGETLDLGAQYVYAFDGNSVYDLTKNLGLFYQAPERHSDLLSWGGYVLKKPLLNGMMKLSLDMAVHDNTSYSRHWLPKLSEYMIKKDISYKDGTLYLDAGRKLFGIHNGADVDEVSAWGISKFRESSYGRSKMWITGFHTFLKILMGEVGNKRPNLGVSKKIMKNKEVTGVDWDDGGVTISCSDGSTYFTDKAILTLPLGVLKNVPKKFFKPPLPKHKAKVIQNLGYGFVDKLFIQFDEPVTHGRNVLFAMHSEMKDQFAAKEKKGLWPTHLTGICPTRDSDTLLNSWLVGQDTFVMEKLSLDQVRDGIMAMTNTVLGKEVPNPKALLRSKWATDKYSLGSYSFRSTNTEIHNVSHGQLAFPLLNSYGKPVVLFAGEATSELHYGTVHGALESGRDAVDVLIQSLNDSK